MSNQHVGRFQDIGAAAVILLQRDDDGPWKIFFKIQDILDVCSTPGIDGLIWIAHGKDVVMLRCKQFCQCVLCDIRVLILVNEDKSEAILILCKNIGKETEELHCLA